jgi:UDP-N-acetylglucosamine 2-epimerase (non-hydrolysing)
MLETGSVARGHVLCVLGTRPEAIKLAPVILALLEQEVAVTIGCTGQHPGLARAALADFGLVPDIDLDLMMTTPTIDGFVAAAWRQIGAVIARTRPAMVVVQGDTGSTLAGALAAAYARVPLAHVEAGLRSGTVEPFPEDLNRRLIAQAATHHFAPTETAQAALTAEGVRADAITVTGNPVIDALRLVAARLAANADLRAEVEATIPLLRARPLVLVTAHRRENHARMPAIATAVAMLAERRDVDIVVSLHPNPAAGAVLRTRLTGIANVSLVAPLGYLAFVTLLGRARVVVTDSGGIQEEAPALGCPVLVLRESTERLEGILAGAARLVGTDPAAIVAAACLLIDDDEAHRAMATAVLPYGDGHAAARIAAIVAAAVRQ